MSNDRKKSKEIEKLRSAFSSLPTRQLEMIEPQIEEAVDMKLMLTELKAQIAEQGMTELFVQGSNSFTRETPPMKLYNAIVKNYTQLMKQLMAKMPMDETEAGDQLIKWLNDSKRE